jgi:hypothetical protein
MKGIVATTKRYLKLVSPTKTFDLAFVFCHQRYSDATPSGFFLSVWDHPKKWVVVEEFVICDVAPGHQRISGPVILSSPYISGN